MAVQERSEKARLTFIGLFGIYVVEGFTFTDMAERQPIPISEPQRGPHEGGNGAPGLPRTVHESAKPPPESPAQGRSEHTHVQQLLERRGAVFDCVVPKITLDLFTIRRMLKDKNLTKIEAKRLEQQWLDSLKRMDRQTLEITLRRSEKQWADLNESSKRNGLTTHGQTLLPDLDEQVRTIREELHNRSS